MTGTLLERADRSSEIHSIQALRVGNVSLRWRPRAATVAVMLVVVLLATAGLHLAIGGTPLDYFVVIRSLLGDESDPMAHLAVTEFRAPRTAAAILVGACLAASGAITQTVARNALASPDIMGITSGAAFGAVAVLVAAGGGAAGLSGVAASIGMPVAAFTAGLLSGVAVYTLAYRRGIDSYRLILVGLGVAGLATSLTTWLLTLGDVSSAAQALTWMMGSLNGKDWTLVQPMFALAVLLLIAATCLSQLLIITSLGDETAVGLGSRLTAVRLTALTIAVLLASLATVVAGPLAFVALASPQIARLLTSSAVPPIAISALFGAVFVMIADILASHSLPVGLPVGVGTAILGAPYLIFLLVRSRRSFS